MLLKVSSMTSNKHVEDAQGHRSLGKCSAGPRGDRAARPCDWGGDAGQPGAGRCGGTGTLTLEEGEQSGPSTLEDSWEACSEVNHSVTM